jgi:hypothetical protein
MSATPAAAPAAAPTQSKALQWSSVVFTGVGAATFLGTFITTLKLVGSSDSWAIIKGQITGVLIATLLGGVIFSIGLMLLVISRPSLTSWLPTLLSALALTISMSAISVAAISR